ncbi:PREDICTED: centriolin isoform X1 [Cyprinodon variegatus]|uniref:centriolin isoform X1 n=1 Tax=Cyprinodon variegatus TaxID=28743 RepID=UPI000742C689|nr:PREDICTED: centriolin isoform X1 [Cyprinodon variegatus]XP_015250754.1 PREDICTED: centriolin isoform X1 [Cyprinodon variegatus]
MTVRLLSTMSRKDGELESRLDDLVSRIAMETQEIRELEQQLTRGQTLASEALQKDLQEVICGLQEYLSGLRQQVPKHLEDAQLSALWAEAQALRDRQVELEAELQRLREELNRLVGDVQVQLDQSSAQFNQTRIQLERFTAGLSEPQQDQRKPMLKVRSVQQLGGLTQDLQLDQNQGGSWISKEKLQAPSLLSQGTLDSGLGLQYSSSPDRGQQRGCVCGRATPPDPSDPPRCPRGVLRRPPAGGALKPVSQQDPDQEKKQLRRHRSVLQVCDELQCLERTLLRRRAELRRADRLLLEAQSCTRTARRNADTLQLRLEDGASCLLEAGQRLRKLKEEAELLRRKKEEEEVRLSQVEEKLRSRRQELQRLGVKVHGAADRLAVLLSACGAAEEQLAPPTCQVQREEQQVQLRGRRSAGSGVHQEEEQKLVRLKAELRSRRTELREVLQELLVEQQVLEEVKSKRTQTLQQLQEAREELQRIRSEAEEKQQELNKQWSVRS